MTTSHLLAPKVPSFLEVLDKLHPGWQQGITKHLPYSDAIVTVKFVYESVRDALCAAWMIVEKTYGRPQIDWDGVPFSYEQVLSRLNEGIENYNDAVLSPKRNAKILDEWLFELNDDCYLVFALRYAKRVQQIVGQNPHNSLHSATVTEEQLAAFRMNWPQISAKLRELPVINSNGILAPFRREKDLGVRFAKSGGSAKYVTMAKELPSAERFFRRPTTERPPAGGIATPKLSSWPPEVIPAPDNQTQRKATRKAAKKDRDKRIRDLRKIHKTGNCWARLYRIAKEDPVIKTLGEPISRHIVRDVFTGSRGKKTTKKTSSRPSYKFVK